MRLGAGFSFAEPFPENLQGCIGKLTYGCAWPLASEQGSTVPPSHTNENEIVPFSGSAVREHLENVRAIVTVIAWDGKGFNWEAAIGDRAAVSARRSRLTALPQQGTKSKADLYSANHY
jgi:hypothetical protein